MKMFSVLILTGLLCACATVHPGPSGKVISGNPDLVVSAEKNDDYSDDTNQFYTVTIENKGTQWLRVDEVDLDFSNTENIEHRVVVGQDLQAWIDSNAAKMAVKAQNDRMIDEIIGLSGAAVMVGSAYSRNRTGTLLGAAAYAGAATHEAVRGEKALITQAESAPLVPTSHLYAPFTVPSSGFRRAWFVVHTPQKRITGWARLKLKTVDGKLSEIKVPMGPGVVL